MKELQVHFSQSYDVDPYYLTCSMYKNQTRCTQAESSGCKWFGGSLNHCARLMFFQKHVQSKMDAVAAFSILTCIVDVLFLMMLWNWRDEFGMTYGSRHDRDSMHPGGALSVLPAFSSSGNSMASASSSSLPQKGQSDL